MRHHLAIVLVLALALPVLAGCVGGKDKGPTGPGIVNVDPNAGQPRANNATLDPGLKDLPTAHFHHYWSDLQEVTIFGNIDGTGAPVILDGPTFAYFNQNTLYGAEFNLESDADDVTRTDEPVMSGKADTVFVGTKEIKVRIDWTSDVIPVEKIFFQWKPANTNKYKPEGGGQIFLSGSEYYIPLSEVGQSDPAHQFAVSRWSFRIWAISQAAEDIGQSDLPAGTTVLVPPDFPVNVNMVAVNGGESNLDPPHPNFWTQGDQISLGATDEVTVDSAEPAVMTPIVRERHALLTDIAVPPGNIVPLGTEKVVVRLKYTTTFPPVEPEGFSLGLAYHGADTLAYTFLGLPTTTDGEWLVWEVLTADPTNPDAEIKVDPPYETNSQWKFELVPMVQDGASVAEAPNGGEVNVQRYVGGWAGTYQLEFEASKVPGFVLV